MKTAQKIMMLKDIKEVLNSKQIMIPMIIVPIVLSVFIPIAMTIFAGTSIPGINTIDKVPEVLMKQLEQYNSKQQTVLFGINYLFPVIFLLIPIMSSTILGASSFVGEKERKTLETLMYTPITIKDLFFAKVVSVSVPSYIIALISFITFGFVANISGFMYFDKLIFPNLKWILLILWLSPAIIFLSLTIIVMISAKAKTFQEAQQISGLIIVPIIFLMVGQVFGLFLLNEMLIVGLGLVIYILDYILVSKALTNFTPEKLL